MSKHQRRVLKALRRRSMTTAEIIEQCGLLRPASVIQYLRASGHLIMTTRGKAQMARYTLIRARA